MHWVWLGYASEKILFFYNVIMNQSISVDVFGSNDFIYLDGKSKNNYILSATADETCLLYIRPSVAIKGGSERCRLSLDLWYRSD